VVDDEVAPPPSGRHAFRDPVAAYLWKVSPWDHKAHAYDRPLGEVTAAAICTHSAGTDRLHKYDGVTPRCPGCLVVIGERLADRQAEEAVRVWESDHASIRAERDDRHRLIEEG